MSSRLYLHSHFQRRPPPPPTPPPASFNTPPLTHVCNAMYAPYAQTHTEGTCKNKVAMDLKTQLFWIYIKAHIHTHTPYTKNILCNIHKQNASVHNRTLPGEHYLFQIIPSDKINATVYEVIALMGHTPLR